MGVSAIAEKIRNAKLRGGGVYLNPGKGEVLILEAKIFETSESGAVFASNFVVDKCEPFKIDGRPSGGNPVGSVAGIACCIEDPDKYKREYAFEDMTKFLCAALDETQDKIADNLDGILSLDAKGVTDMKKPQVLRGLRVGYTTREITTAPKDGSPKKALTKVDFFHIKQTKDEQAACAAMLDQKFPLPK